MRMRKLKRKRPSEPSAPSADGQGVPKIDDFKDVFDSVTDGGENVDFDYEKSLSMLKSLLELNGG